VKTVGAMRGMCVDSILVVQICCLISLYNFVPVLHHKFVLSICSTTSFYLTFTLILFLSHMLSFSLINILCSQIGTAAMASKLKNRDIVKKKIIKRKQLPS
jgi:hypothetical protein